MKVYKNQNGDTFAYEADGVILINRVKPHTNFRGSIESGVVKMMTIQPKLQKQLMSI